MAVKQYTLCLCIYTFNGVTCLTYAIQKSTILHDKATLLRWLPRENYSLYIHSAFNLLSRIAKRITYDLAKAPNSRWTQTYLYLPTWSWSVLHSSADLHSKSLSTCHCPTSCLAFENISFQCLTWSGALLLPKMICPIGSFRPHRSKSITDTRKLVWRIRSVGTSKEKVSSKTGFNVFCLIEVRFFSVRFPSVICQILTYGSEMQVLSEKLNRD